FGVPVLYLRSFDNLIVAKPVVGEGGSPSHQVTNTTAVDSIAGRGQATYVCPDCNTVIKRADPKCCPACGLKFVCPSCEWRLTDPMLPRCDECGELIQLVAAKAADSDTDAALSLATPTHATNPGHVAGGAVARLTAEQFNNPGP